jgi:hypothetical protein
MRRNSAGTISLPFHNVPDHGTMPAPTISFLRRLNITSSAFDFGTSMGITEALQILTFELIESHARCHYPYVVISGPCAIGGPLNPEAGVYITIESDVFGRIASASATTWENALLAVCEDLDKTRVSRWAAESKRKA